MNPPRQKRSGFYTALMVVLGMGLLAGGAFWPSDPKPLRCVPLQFKPSEYIVPAGEVWRLGWNNPYAPGEVVPAYDVRITHGAARLGWLGAIQASAYLQVPGVTGLLDLNATRGEAFVWLDAGTSFSIANGRLEITATAYARRDL